MPCCAMLLPAPLAMLPLRLMLLRDTRYYYYCRCRPSSDTLFRHALPIAYYFAITLMLFIISLYAAAITLMPPCRYYCFRYYAAMPPLFR
jgi:hypothetical protein